MRKEVCPVNRNEFYKQLMSEYSFDADKIRENAKRGKSARQKLQPMYIGMTAAAAALVVTVGTLAAVNLTKNNGVSLTDSGLATLSANDRVLHAIEQLEKERGSEESKDFLVTFASPLTPAEAQAVLTGSADGSIPVKQLCFADGTRINSADSIGKVFENGDGRLITGAAVYCTGDTAAKLQSDPAVFLIEIMTESDFQNAAPVNISDVDTTEVTLPDNSNILTPVTPEPDVTPPAPAEDNSSASEEMDGTVEPESPTEEMDGTAEPAATTEAVTEEADDPQSGEEPPAETTPAETTQPTEPSAPEETVSQPEETITPGTLPDGVTLPADVSGLNYTAYIDADTAFFLTDDVFYVKNGSSVALYRTDGTSETMLCSESIVDAKLVWVAENGRRLIVSGMSEYGTRGRLLMVDAQAESITDLHAEDMVLTSVLQSASYNADSRLLVLNVREDGMYYIITAHYSGADGDTAEYSATPYESSNKLTVAAAYGSTVYFTEVSGGSTKLYSLSQDGETALIHDFGSVVSVSRNFAFTHAVFTPESGSAIGFTEVFDPESGRLIQLYGSDTSNVSFGASKHSFSCGGSVYTIAGGTAAASGGLSVTAAIDYRKSFSEKFAATASNGYVRISDSIYSAQNKSSLMTFSDITENSSSELRAALNGAIGVNNVIALGSCRQNGITTPESLVSCIKLYYSDNAVNSLLQRSNISSLGALHYNNGGLTAINSADTVLVVSSQSADSASGMLYIGAGSFAGKNAFRTVSVSFIRENGAWKLDSIF